MRISRPISALAVTLALAAPAVAAPSVLAAGPTPAPAPEQSAKKDFWNDQAVSGMPNYGWFIVGGGVLAKVGYELLHRYGSARFGRLTYYGRVVNATSAQDKFMKKHGLELGHIANEDFTTDKSVVVQAGSSALQTVYNGLDATQKPEFLSTLRKLRSEGTVVRNAPEGWWFKSALPTPGALDNSHPGELAVSSRTNLGVFLDRVNAFHTRVGANAFDGVKPPREVIK